MGRRGVHRSGKASIGRRFTDRITAAEFRRRAAKKAPGKKAPKYGNKIVYVDGMKFHSKAEAAKYAELRLRERQGEIRDLCADKKQLKFPLVVKGKLISSYTPDFRWFDVKLNRTIYADFKGGYYWKHKSDGATQAYRIRKKLMEALYGIEIVELE